MIDNCTRINIYAPYPVDYQYIINPKANKLGIILHGYAQNSQEIKESLKELVLDESYNWFIPNGIFPMPKQLNKEVKYRFAWYFYDSIKEKYFIDFSYPTNVLQNFLKKVNTDNLPITIIGYSQGGYLAPFLAQATPEVKKVISINANYRHDMLLDDFNFEFYAVHAVNDDVVNYEKSKTSFDVIKSKASHAQFISITDTKHLINDKIITEILKLI